jgi:HAD superfamily phosphatase (TIGR01668 family)
MKALGYTKEHAPGTISPYLPDFIADDIMAVDFAELKRIGVTHIMLDLDQTIRRAYSKNLEDEVIKTFQMLKKKRMFSMIIIASNNSRNLTKFAAPIEARVFQPFWTNGKLIRKPNPIFFSRIMQELGIKPIQAAMIGDKLRADIIGGNKAGIRTVLIKPRGYDYWYDQLLFSRLRERRYYRQALEARRKHTSSTVGYLQAALLQAGLPAKQISQLPDSKSGSSPYIARDSRQAIFIKLISRQQNFKDFLRRFGQRLALPYLADEMPYFGPQHALEHEAKIASLAYEAGVQTPKVKQIIDLGDYRYGLAMEYIAGKNLDQLSGKQINDKLLQEAWRQIYLLHAAHIAHRDLRAANVITDGTRVWLIDFDLGITKASKRSLAQDKAEFLISTCLLVGLERAVNNALPQLKSADLRLMLSLLRPSKFSEPIRRSLREHPNLLAELHTRLERQFKTGS